MEPVVTKESIDELPWGPGAIKLALPLEIEIKDDPDTNTVTVYSELLGVWGDGTDYTEALIDFAGIVESLVDDLRNSHSESALNLLAKIEQYFPQDDY